jgi:hypothetical protein
MKKLAGLGYRPTILLALVCSAASFAGDLPQDRDCTLRQLATIDLEIADHVLVPVTLDGTPARMILGTSSGLSTIYKRDADDMNLTVVKSPLPNWQMTTVHSFSLGSYKVGKAQLLLTTKLPTLAPNAAPYVGVFGLTALSGVDFELDFAHNKLNLFSAKHCSGNNVVYWADSAASVPYSADPLGVPVFPIELDGKKVAATVDAGASVTQLKTDISKLLYGFDDHSPGTETRTADSGTSVKHYRAMKMTGRGLSVTNADVELIPGSDSCIISRTGPGHSATYENCFGRPPLTLGVDVLRHLRVYFATTEHVLYITTADAVPDVKPAAQ